MAEKLENTLPTKDAIVSTDFFRMIGGANGVSYKKEISGLTEYLVNLVYPVGSYYETSKSTDEFDPNTVWPGTWTLETNGQVHVSAGGDYSLGSTGGEATHTLTSGESGVPAHGHSFTDPTFTASGGAVTEKAQATSGTPSTNPSGTPSSNTSGTPSTNTSGSGSNHYHKGIDDDRYVVALWNSGYKNFLVQTSQYSNSKMVYGYDGDQPTAFGNAQNTAGESSHTHSLSNHTHGLGNHTHTLGNHTHTIPAHTHSFTQPTITKSTGGSVTNNDAANATDAHNNMQPYIVVNRWHRTA